MSAPTGTVTLVFTGIEGSGELWERLGAAFEPVLALHQRAIREALAARGGYEVKVEGDAFMLAFARATEAMQFAQEAQEGLARQEWPASTGEIRVRMGVHTGVPICAPDPAGRMDYFGPVVNRAARIAAAAHGGQILISEAARAAAREALETAAVSDLGEHRLRGLERPERLWQVLPRSLQARRFGELRTLSAAPTNLPAQSSSFVGRERELGELGALLADPGAWLVTLTGSPGTGKSRLALRGALDALDRFPGGVWVADVSEATDAGGVAKAAAAALGVLLKTEELPEQAFGDVLEFREPLLLLLDNFDQVSGAAEETVGRWRRRAPRVKFLVTCRSVLGVAGEHECALDPLPSPPRQGDWARTPELLATFDGVRLFLDRAREADPHFALTPSNAADIAVICAELEGIPLAIELAAARVRIMKPAQIVAKLGQRFELLRSSRSGVPARQQTLQGAIAWSYAMLQEWEKDAFEQLCAFRGGFSLEAAEAVLDLGAFPDAPPGMDAVQRLRERSFLRSWESAGELRFGMFATIREFGERRLRERTDPASRRAIEERHAAWFGDRVQEWGGDADQGADATVFDRFDADRENILAAHARRLEAGDAVTAARLLTGMKLYASARGRHGEFLPPLERTLERLPQEARGARASLLNLAAEARRVTGDWVGSRQSAEQALACAREDGDLRQVASALNMVALLDRLQKNPEEAVRGHQEAIAIRESLGDRVGAAMVEGPLSMALTARGRIQEALERLARAETVLRGVGRRKALANHLNHRALALAHVGRLPDAVAALLECESIHRELGDLGGVAVARMNLGRYLMNMGDLEQAMACFAESESIFRRAGDKPALGFVIRSRGNILRRRGEYDEALRCYDASEIIERELGNWSSMIAQHRGRGHLNFLRGDLEEAERHYRGAGDLAAETGDLASRAAVEADLAAVAMGRLRWDEVLRRSEEGLRRGRETGDPGWGAEFVTRRSRALVETGRTAEGMELILEAVVQGRASGNLMTLADALWTLTAILLKAGRPREAIDAAVEALDAFQKFSTANRCDALECRVLKARAEAAVGLADAARRTATECWKIVDALGLERRTSHPAACEWIEELRRLAPR